MSQNGALQGWVQYLDSVMTVTAGKENAVCSPLATGPPRKRQRASPPTTDPLLPRHQKPIPGAAAPAEDFFDEADDELLCQLLDDLEAKGQGRQGAAAVAAEVNQGRFIRCLVTAVQQCPPPCRRKVASAVAHGSSEPV